MGDIYSFGSMYIESKVLKEIFEQDDELKELIIDDEENAIDTNFNGNDQVRFPDNEREIVKTLDDLMDYLTLIKHEGDFYRGGIVGNFESFSDLEWGEDNPPKKKIIDQMVSKKKEIIESIVYASLHFSASGYHPDDDTALLMIQHFVEEYEDEYFSVSSFDFTISYEYEKGKNTWHVKGEFHVDFLDEPIMIDEGRESTTNSKPKKQKRKTSRSKRPELSPDLAKLYQSLTDQYETMDSDELEFHGMKFGTQLRHDLTTYEHQSGTNGDFIFSGISALPTIIDGEFSLEESKILKKLQDFIPDFQGFPDEFMEELAESKERAEFVDKILQLLDVLLAMRVIQKLPLVNYFLILATADGVILDSEEKLISSFLMEPMDRVVYRLYEKAIEKSFLTKAEIEEYLVERSIESIDEVINALESYGVDIV